MQDWIIDETKACRMPDKRLQNRLQLLMESLAIEPNGSIPHCCQQWAATQAAYRFLNNPKVNADDILRGHSQATLERMKAQPVVLVVQDTTFINLAVETRKANLGTLAVKDSNNYLLHPCVAFTPERTNLGIVHHDCWQRPDEPIGHLRHMKSIEEKESLRWRDGYETCHALQTHMPDTTVVMVADRESDIYEIFYSAQSTPAEQRAEFIVRAKANRLVDVEVDEDERLLWEVMAATPSVGQYQISLARTKYRRERDAMFAVRIREVTFLRGKRRGGNLPAVSLYAVYATEIDPPENEAAIEWMLLTSLPVENLAQAQTIIGWYQARWEIEIYFRVLKSGCHVEDLRLEHADRLEKAFAVYMIIAWRLHNMTMLAREMPESPCTIIFGDSEWKLIYTLQMKKTPRTVPTIREMTRYLAMLGGFLARKGDGEPGVETIWRGYTKILNYFEIAAQLKTIGVS